MKHTSKRVCIYPKDIQRITGKSYRQSTRILNQIRTSLNKSKNSLITINEFCDYIGLKQEQIEHLIK